MVGIHSPCLSAKAPLRPKGLHCSPSAEALIQYHISALTLRTFKSQIWAQKHWEIPEVLSSFRLWEQDKSKVSLACMCRKKWAYVAFSATHTQKKKGGKKRRTLLSTQPLSARGVEEWGPSTAAELNPIYHRKCYLCLHWITQWYLFTGHKQLICYLKSRSINYMFLHVFWSRMPSCFGVAIANFTQGLTLVSWHVAHVDLQ